MFYFSHIIDSIILIYTLRQEVSVDSVWQSVVWQGQAEQSMARSGEARIPLVPFPRRGLLWLAGATPGVASYGSGKVRWREARQIRVWFGLVRHGKERNGWVRHGEARIGKCTAGLGRAGLGEDSFSPFTSGSAWFGLAEYGPVRQASARQGIVW